MRSLPPREAFVMLNLLLLRPTNTSSNALMWREIERFMKKCK